MNFGTLEQVSLEELLDVFNRSFKGYFVPLQLTAEQLQKKLDMDNYDPALSTGVFRDGRLWGFIIHGIDRFNGVLTAYNGGTGVLPEHRGSALTGKMYAYALPRLQGAGIEQCLLEVIDRNTAAVRSYERAGFRTTRRLDCFRGSFHRSAAWLNSTEASIRKMTEAEKEAGRAFREWTPAWQNADRSTARSDDIYCTGWFREGELRGYVCHHKNNSMIYRFAVHPDHRRKGVATALFRHLAESQPGADHLFHMINQDASDPATSSFLNSIGLDRFLTQLEMIMVLK